MLSESDLNLIIWPLATVIVCEHVILSVGRKSYIDNTASGVQLHTVQTLFLLALPFRHFFPTVSVTVDGLEDPVHDVVHSEIYIHVYFGAFIDPVDALKGQKGFNHQQHCSSFTIRQQSCLLNDDKQNAKSAPQKISFFYLFIFDFVLSYCDCVYIKKICFTHTSRE